MFALIFCFRFLLEIVLRAMSTRVKNAEFQWEYCAAKTRIRCTTFRVWFIFKIIYRGDKRYTLSKRRAAFSDMFRTIPFWCPRASLSSSLNCLENTETIHLKNLVFIVLFYQKRKPESVSIRSRIINANSQSHFTLLPKKFTDHFAINCISNIWNAYFHTLLVFSRCLNASYQLSLKMSI